MATITHPRSGKTIEGRLLWGGEFLEKGDVHDSRSGEWEECPYVEGMTPSWRCDTIWVRPNSSNSLEPSA
jgi:hypothetical protein